MLPGPVFTFELLTLARRARYYALRTVYGLLLLFLVWINNPEFSGYSRVSTTGEMSIPEMAQLGSTIFATFATAQSVVILLITPALVAGVIADERRRKTLHYLLASQLTSAEIILGKLFARSLNVGVLVALGLPIVVMLSLFGGVDPNIVLLFFAASVTTVFFLASLSIAVSTYAGRPRDAVITVYLIELVWLFAPSLIGWLFPSFGGVWLVIYDLVRPVVTWVGSSSPLFFLGNLGGLFSSPWAFIEAVFWMMGLQFVFGLSLVALAILRLRPIFRKEGASSGRLSKFFSRKARRLLPRPACGDDAMWWKERYVSRAGSMTRIVGAIVLLFVGSLLVYGTAYFGRPAYFELLENGYGTQNGYWRREQLNGWLRFVITLLGGVLLIGTAASAASGLTSEREDDTWVSLLSTPLTAVEIVRAKMFGAFWGMRFILFFWFGFLTVGVGLGAIHLVGLAAEIVCTAVFVAFGCALGTFFSLHARNTARSLTSTVGTLILLNGVYLLLFVTIRMESTIRLVGVTPFVEAVVLASYSDINNLFVSSNQFPRSLDVIMACVISVALHGFGASLLAFSTVAMFDNVIDRPGVLRASSFGGSPPGRNGPRPLPGRELGFIEEESEPDTEGKLI